MEPVGHHGHNGLFSKSNDPRSRFIGYSEFRRYFRQIFAWTFVKTLAMEPVGHHGQNIPFSRSNNPRSGPRDLLVAQNYGVIFAKNLHGLWLRP
ncbi:hypothetical protein H5410_019319 [Solanum commersonii]|uniref:Uncharacterized protein n=1 Tax=Solanum commersonii TaxID=4109 RepID=A0A9J5ZAT1_SOLCO|nr:hypothetical protein H5410_019319 [Solanum commersonii]